LHDLLIHDNVEKLVNSPQEPPKKRQRAIKDAKPADQDVKDGESKDDIKAEDDTMEEDRQYWLMKAEPETRLEGGVDVKFSIDDLAAKVSLQTTTYDV
jgi:hypothetical protein